MNPSRKVHSHFYSYLSEIYLQCDSSLCYVACWELHSEAELHALEQTLTDLSWLFSLAQMCKWFFWNEKVELLEFHFKQRLQQNDNFLGKQYSNRPDFEYITQKKLKQEILEVDTGFSSLLVFS